MNQNNKNKENNNTPNTMKISYCNAYYATKSWLEKYNQLINWFNFRKTLYHR